MAEFITSENAKALDFQTHYYKATYEEIKELYVKTVKKMKYTVVSENDDYCEVYAEAPHMEVIAKITQLEPTQKETAIDFEIHADYAIGASKKAVSFIKEVLAAIEEKYEFKGASLHK